MKTDFQNRFCTVDGIKVRYWDEGEGEPLVLIHGIMVSIETWAYNIEALSNKYRVIAFDIPGNGRSERSERDDIYTLEYGGNFISKLADHLNIHRMNLVGNSMGGILALQFMEMFPERLNKLILVDAAGLGRSISFSFRIFSVQPLGELFFHPNKSAVEFIANKLIYDKKLITPNLIKSNLDMITIPGTKKATLKMIRAGVNIKGITAYYGKEKLAKFFKPVLVVWGKQDTALQLSHAKNALDYFPDCRVVILDKAGHAPQIDRSESFNKIVLEFLKSGSLSLEDNSATKEFILLQ